MGETMRAGTMGSYDGMNEGVDQKVNQPPRGERIAAYVDDYLTVRRGMTLGELAFALRADKRDLQRLLREKSCGPRLEEDLHQYFGREFGEAIFGHLWGDGPSRRERDLERQRAEHAARRERIESERLECRRFRSDPGSLPGMGVG